MIFTWITAIFYKVKTVSCQLCKRRNRANCTNRRMTISFIWTRVTAADFDLQQSPYATPLLTAAPLPIGGVRHKILTRSMRFLHTPATGNHSREEGEIWRRREKQRWEEENQEILQSQRSFCQDLVRETWERSTRQLLWHETNDVCSDSHSDIVVDAAY